jgi:glucose-1-phosphate cytidylyltransferase
VRTVILAGGRGTRLAEETDIRPKPMVEIGGQPILWHIMQIYASAGFRDFVVACGYKSHMIKEYFLQFYAHNSDFTVDLRNGKADVLGSRSLDWRVSVVDTGLDTPTAGRILKLKSMLAGQRCFVTYGDGVSNVDLKALLAFHLHHGRLATVTAVRPPARFGGLDLEGDRVAQFTEKPQASAGWINGGFFVFEQEAMEYMRPDAMLEQDPLEQLAANGELMAYRHEGFWQPMDTIRDRDSLESLWASGRAPWKLW